MDKLSCLTSWCILFNALFKICSPFIKCCIFISKIHVDDCREYSIYFNVCGYLSKIQKKRIIRLLNERVLSLENYVRYGCLKDVFCTLLMSQRRFLYVMDVSKTFFVHYGCLKDVFCTLWMSQRRLFVCYWCLKDVFCTLWMSQRRILYVMDVSKTFFVSYGCLKDVFCTLWMSQRRPVFTVFVKWTTNKKVTTVFYNICVILGWKICTNLIEMISKSTSEGFASVCKFFIYM